MFGDFLDSIVGVFSPRAGFQRQQYRRAMGLQKRSYDASRTNRNTYNWNATTSSADRAMFAHAERVRDRVRDLIRNNAYARGALDAIVANVVECGIKPRLSAGPIADAWNRWCEASDAAGRLHFYEMQSLALRETIEAGEVLNHYTGDASRKELGLAPLMLELIEAERIDSNQDSVFRRDSADGVIRRGVRLNKSNKALGYYLYDIHPSEAIYGYNSTFYSAADILHLFRQERAGQTRGVSWLAPVVMWLKDLHVYVENELQASAVAACFTVAIKTVDSGASFGELAPAVGADDSDLDGNRFSNIQPGLVSHLMPGEDIETINPGRPNAQAEPWINLMLRSIAVGMGLSYELVSRDYSQTNFSSNRASSLEDRKRFRPLQKWMVNHYCKPIFYEWFYSSCLAGLDGFPPVDEFLMTPERYINVQWHAPGWEWVDPLKEAQAARIAVETGFTSRTQVIAEHGGDISQVFAELAEENTMADELDLNLMADEPNSKTEAMNGDKEGQVASAAK